MCIRDRAKGETMAIRLKSDSKDGAREEVSSSALRSGDLIYVAAGLYIPGDGEVIEGVASVDELSLIHIYRRSISLRRASLNAACRRSLSEILLMKIADARNDSSAIQFCGSAMVKLPMGGRKKKLYSNVHPMERQIE